MTLRSFWVLGCLLMAAALLDSACSGCEEDPLAGRLGPGLADAGDAGADAGVLDAAAPDAAPDSGAAGDLAAELDGPAALDAAADAEQPSDSGASADSGPPADLGPGPDPDAGPQLHVEPPFTWDGPLRLPASPRTGASLGDTAWLCLDSGWVQPISAAPARFVPLVPMLLDGPCSDVTVDVADERLWVTQGELGVVELDVSDPEQPETVQVIETEHPAVLCEHDDLWDWIYVTTRGPDGDRVLRVDGSGAEPGRILATSPALGLRAAHLVSTGQQVVLVGEQGRVTACPTASLLPSPVAVGGAPGPAVGAVVAGPDVLVAYADRIVRLVEQDGRVVSAGVVPNAPARFGRWHGRGSVGICGCGPDGRGVGVIRTHVPGAPGTVETIGLLEGTPPTFTLATQGAALVGWGPTIGLLDVPPLVARLQPPADSTGCRPHCAAEVAFSEPVELPPDGLRLTGPEGALATSSEPVSGEVDPTYRLTPDDLLLPETAYTASVEDSVSDEGGLRLWPEGATETPFLTGPPMDRPPLETGGTMPLGAVLGADTDGAQVAACTARGKLEVTTLQGGRAVAPRRRRRLAGPCAALAVDGLRQRAHVALGDNGIATVDLAAPATTKPWRTKAPSGGACRALEAVETAGALYSVCGGALQRWDLGPVVGAPRPRLVGSTDAGLVAGATHLAVLEQHVVVVDGAGTLTSFDKDRLEPSDVRAGLATPSGLARLDSGVLVELAGGGTLAKVPVDEHGRFGAPSPELEVPGLSSFDARGRLLATTVDGVEVGLYGRAARAGASTWLPLGERHSYPPPVHAQATADGALVAHDGGWSLLDAPPFLVEASPEDGATSLPLDLVPEAHYSEPLSASEGALSLWQDDAEVPATLTLSEDRTTARLSPDAALIPDMPYHLHLGDAPSDSRGQRLQPPGLGRRTIRTGPSEPGSCDELDCAASGRGCTLLGRVARCAGCLPEHHETPEGPCTPDTCDDLSCGDERRECADAALPARCGGCVVGHHDVEGWCVPLTCADLDCVARQRRCDDSGAFALCAECLQGHHELTGTCRPDTCAELDCGGQGRACLDDELPARCGACLPGHHEQGDGCPPDTCADLNCEALQRVCDDSGAFARCGGCRQGYVEGAAGCEAVDCERLGCAAAHRQCTVDAGQPACGDCSQGYHADGDACRPDTCADLDCAARQRVCDESGPFAICGGCRPGYVLDGGLCRLPTCADLGCVAWHRGCSEGAQGAACGDCLAGYHADGQACVPDACADLDCVAERRVCDESGPHARCGDCLGGYHGVGHACAPDTCAELNCAALLRSCDAQGDYDACGACLPGHHEDEGACLPDPTCEALGCHAQGRACVDEGPATHCGECLPAHREEGDGCVPLTCADLNCAARSRHCLDARAPADCGDCLPEHVERAGACVPDGCVEAGCAELHRICDSAGPETRCGECLPDYSEEAGGCVPGPCAERECGPDGDGGHCGHCGPGQYCSEAAACLPVNIGGGEDPPGQARTVYLDRETLLVDRAQPDMPVRPVVALAGAEVALDGDLEGFEPGDEVMIVNLRGEPGASHTVGAYELAAVRALDAATSTITLHWPLQRQLVPQDSEGLGGQRLALLRVPHYRALTLPAGWTITATGFDGRSGGVLAFAVDGHFTLEAGATVTMDAAGYRGGAGGSGGCNVGTSCAHGVQGESLTGPGARRRTANAGGGGGGTTHRNGPGDWGDGGGGGSAVGLGVRGAGGTPPGESLEPQGSLRLLLGSGGGGGGADGANLGSDRHSAGAGARGGGVIHLRAGALTNAGIIRSRGGAGTNVGSTPGTPGYEAGAGGAGAGGTLYANAPVAASAQRACELVGGLEAVDGAPAFADAGAYLDFMDASQHVQCPAWTRLGAAAGDWSLLAWLRRPAGLPAGVVYSERAGDGSGRVELLVTGDGGLQLAVGDDQGRSGSVSSGAGLAADGQWHLVAATRSGSTLLLYLDGRQVGAAAVSVGGFVTGRATLGARVALAGEPASDSFVGGQLDEVAVFAHALTSERVAALHFHALHDLQPWEVRVTQRQPAAFWRSATDGLSLLDHAEARPGFGRLDVRGGPASASCRAACGGAGGAGRVVLAAGPWDVEPDGFGDGADTCFAATDPAQADQDGDGVGDRCEDDWDGDEVSDPYDAFPQDPAEWSDSDGDGTGDRSDCAPEDPDVHQPECGGRACGPDGCGGSCGGCELTEYCALQEGRCVEFDVQPAAEVAAAVVLDQASLTPGRETPDMATYSVASVEGARVTASAVIDAIAPGDEVLLIHLQGAGAQSVRVGSMESGFVERVEGPDLWLAGPVRAVFGPDGNLDLPGQGQKVALLRVPHYAGLTLRSGGQISASAWNGATGGVLAFAVDGPLQLDAGGLINMNGSGYRGGRGGRGSGGHNSSTARGVQGEGIGGTGGVSTADNRSGGGGGRTTSNGGDWGSGGGGGGNGANGAGAGGVGGRRHELLADPGFAFMGGGGGGGGADPQGWGDSANGTAGARGGGVILLRARSWVNEGTVRANGSQASRPGCTPGAAGNEPAGGGSGAGGTVVLALPAGADPAASCALVGAPVSGVAGALPEQDGATLFDGHDDAADCGSSSWLGDLSAAWTISAWVKVRPGGGGYLYSEAGAHPALDGSVGLAVGQVPGGGAGGPPPPRGPGGGRRGRRGAGPGRRRGRPRQPAGDAARR